MATFTIKRGDSAPPLEISLVASGTTPKTYWKKGDDRPDNRATATDIIQVRFIMKGSDNKIVGATESTPYTGLATSVDVGDSKTVLSYYWGPNDTAVAGTYQGEFEVIYKGPEGSENAFGRKRTFPSTAGDTLVINVTQDLNDE